MTDGLRQTQESAPSVLAARDGSVFILVAKLVPFYTELEQPLGEIGLVTDLYNIEVSVETTYVAEHSEPEEDRFVFAYTITLVNRGSVSAQLLSRHWVITDADSQVEEVRGDGVVGEQPVLLFYFVM